MTTPPDTPAALELAEFARRILCSPDLGAKLARPASLTDAAPAADTAPLPDLPARPPDLALPPPRRRAQERLPGARELATDAGRGRLLHFFANHELLAMELMALVLLRFPDAPPRFRMGLAATILDEQRHLGLYLERMRELGVAFGTAPVSRFFWDAIAGTPSPQAFMAQMALTLEQANLDFALHYRRLFAQAGDERTASILEVVHADEVRHVAHGVGWMERWRSPEESLWDTYVRVLPPPLTPSRAKGVGPLEEGRAARRAAGLPDAFVAELEVYEHSKGRPPIVYTFNPACEDEVADGRPRAFSPPRALAELAQDLAGVMLFLARAEDVVVLPRRPDRAHLAALRDAGFALPQVVDEGDAAERRALRERLVDRVAPWGVSPSAVAHALEIAPKARFPLSAPADARVFRKSWAATLHAELSPETAVSHIATSLADAEAEAARIAAAGGTVALKAPLGTSGRGLLRVLDGVLDERQRAWAARILAEQGEIVIEPWQDKVLDLSVQVEARAGAARVLGVTRFFTDARGQYRGHALGRRRFSDLAPAELRALHEDRMLQRLESVAAAVARALAAAGYEGPAGIDALVHRGADGRLLLRPIVEVNARFTMGRVALALERRIHPSAPAEWLHLPCARLAPAALAAAATSHPLRFRNGLLTHGLLPTTDPAQARRVLTVLAVGDDAIQTLAAAAAV